MPINEIKYEISPVFTDHGRGRSVHNGLLAPSALSFHFQEIWSVNLTIFVDIHVFTQVQTKVEDDYLGES